jgi:hypothetical protein
MRLRAQFGDETLSRTLVYYWSKSFRECWTEAENMRRLHLHLLLGKLWPALFRTFKASYSSIFWQNNEPPTQLIIRSFKRPNKESLSFKTTRSISQKRLSPPRQRAFAVTTGTLKEMHWELLPHPACSSDLTPSDFHLFCPLKEALGGKLFRADDVEPSVQRRLDKEPDFFWNGA